MLENFISTIERHHILPEEGKILVAVSGGADSLCLLHLLLRICGSGKRYPGVTLAAAHLNHMLRGEESERDARAVAAILAEWKVPFTSGKIDVQEYASREKYSLEEAARIVRYRFLREVACGRLIAVGHHADDQVETLLLHWLRGSGLQGLVGMAPRQQDIIRPLLEFTHAETVAYCQQQGIVPLEDHSNADTRFLRNRIRHKILPLLQEINPGIQGTLLRNAEIIRIDLNWLETQIDNLWESVVLTEEDQAIKLDVRAFQALPLSLQHHLLRRVTGRLCHGQSPLEPRHLNLIERLLHQRSDSRERVLNLPQKILVTYWMNHLTLQFAPAQAKEAAVVEVNEALLPVPGEVRVPGTSWIARAELLPAKVEQQVKHALRSEDWQSVWRYLEPASQHTVYIDGQSLNKHLLVRLRKQGDRIQPLGMMKEKKLQDVFVDNHIARSERAMTPLFFSDAHCLWVAGVCLDHRVRLESKTTYIVRLSIQPLETSKPLLSSQVQGLIFP